MLSTIFREVLESHELLGQLVRRDLRLRYRQAVMGFAWALLLPALTIGAGLIIKSVIARGGGAEGSPSIGGIAIKSWAWAFFAGGMTFGTTSLLSNMQLVTKIYFPREILPLSSIAAQGFDSLIGLTVILLLGPWLGFHWSLALIWVPLLVALLVLFTTGLAFLFSCANLFFRDVKYILQVLIMFGIFFTPVFIEPSQASARTGRLLMLNPLGPILEGLRLTLVERQSLAHVVLSANGLPVWTPWHLLYSSVIAIVLVIAGLIAFRRSSRMFAEYY